jgi:hypothetical protein
MGFFASGRVLRKGGRFLGLAGAGAFLAALAVVFPLHNDLAGAALKVAANAPDPLIGKYCMSCHDSEEHVANIAFDKLSLQRVSADPEVWEKVATKLNAGVMPPAGNPRPPADEVHDFLKDLTRRLDATAPAPAPVALRRLNRTEYGYAIRDLLGLSIDPTTLLPPDAASKGFDNIADVLSSSPALIQAYLDTGVKLSRLALGDSSMEPERIVYRAPVGLNHETPLEGLPLGTRGGLRVEHFFPLDAEYEISVDSGAGISGFLRRGPGPMPQVDLTVDGRDYPMSPKGPTRIKVAAGSRPITAALVDPVNAVGVNELYSVYPHKGAIFSIVVNGPFRPTGPGDTASRRKILLCQPRTAAEEQPCARRIVANLATHAFRTPLAADSPEVASIMRFYDAGRGKGGFETGVQYALAYILMDPRFLYRFEREPAKLTAGQQFRVSDIDLASRLSFFLWSSIPDDELLRLAANHRLSDPDELRHQVRRMLADPKAAALVDNFAAQWLRLRELATVEPQSRDFDDNLREAFEREAKLVFASVVNENRSVIDLLNANYTFVNERLARHYGIEGVTGDYFRRVTLPDASPRRGLLGKGAVLTVTSVSNRTSPVIRGAWVLENLLGAPPSPPPPGVENKLDATAAVPTTLRARLAMHRANRVCATCHNMMDPIGLALENYDEVGKWRTLDNGLPIDASGVMVDGTRINGEADLLKALLSRSDAFVATMIEKLMTFGLGRHTTYNDMPAVRHIAQQVAPDGDRFDDIVLGIVLSEPFQMRTASGSATVPIPAHQVTRSNNTRPTGAG